jgi:hypothetical protein
VKGQAIASSAASAAAVACSSVSAGTERKAPSKARACASSIAAAVSRQRFMACSQGAQACAARAVKSGTEA